MVLKNEQQKTQGKIDPQKYVYQGSPPIMPIKTLKTGEREKLKFSGFFPINEMKIML